MEWRPVVGFEGLYEVSSTGRVRSLPRTVKHWTGVDIKRKGKELSRTPLGLYLHVTLCKDGRYQSYRVHTLVAAAFHGPRPVGVMVRHMDGDGTNNKASNIVYGTAQDNSDDTARHGRVPRGEAHSGSKLTEAKVRHIRELLKTHPATVVARMVGMSGQQISNIKLRKAWAHVKD